MRGSVLGAALLLKMVIAAAAQSDGLVQPAHIVRALRRDLHAIPPGVPPTDAQRRALSVDLGRVFRAVNFPPVVTLDYVAGKLADTAAHGRFVGDDLDNLAQEVTAVVTGSTYNDAGVSALTASLVNAGSDVADAQQLAAGVRALPYSALSFTTGHTRSLRARPVDPTAPNYRHTYLSSVELDTMVGPETAHGVVTSPDRPTQGLTVGLSQVPLGRYQVRVTTVSSDQPVELGPLRVRPGPLIFSPKILINPRSGVARFGYPDSAPLPDGLLVDDIATVSVTDDQGVVRMQADFAGASPTELFLTHAAIGHLTATTLAPTVGGRCSAVVAGDASSLEGSLLCSAVGLPANATLMFLVNGAVIQPVTVGPTGNLFVKTSRAVFPRPPRSTEIINLLPDTLDLFTTTSFAVTDVQGNVLLSAGLEP